jgi:flagellar FliL protein
LDSYIVNLKDGRRYLKTTIQLMLSEEMANAYLTARIVEIKDIVLSELQDLSVEDVKQAESREALRQRLISAISQIFPTKPEWADPEPIKKVLFEEFVLQ